jgi:hypothetical protein
LDDVTGLYFRSRVECAPILSGGWDAREDYRSSSPRRIEADGLEMHDGRELLLRNDAVTFAEACLGLLKGSQLACNVAWHHDLDAWL